MLCARNSVHIALRCGEKEGGLEGGRDGVSREGLRLRMGMGRESVRAHAKNWDDAAGSTAARARIRP